jgi:eukaryotic-like serine/threonine-protein kinase
MKTDSNSLAVSAGLRAALGYYRLVAEIGRGGMASVFLSLFPNGDGTSRKVVLKQLHPELATDDDFRVMFEDEARLATRLHHDNIVETYDVYSDLDLCVLVMEFLDGQTLSRIRQRARSASHVPLSIHLRILAEALAGLHYVHELTDANGNPLGIVHRDVTPSNVLVTYDGRVKVLDFGIAKATTCVAHTRMGVIKGKLAYMSPEAVRGEPVDRRSDIFSVGVMLWEAATGLRLWQDHDEVAVFRRLLTGDLPLHPLGAQIAHPELFRIAERALAVDPCQRYATAAELKQEVEDVLSQLGNAPSAAALSAYMESSFTMEREKLQAVVERALACSSAPPVSQRRLLASDLCDSYSALDVSPPPTAASTSSGGTFRTYDVPIDFGEGADRFSPRHGFLMAAAATAATLAITVAFAAHLPSGRRSGWFGSALQPSPATAAASLPAPQDAALPTVEPSATSTAEPAAELGRDVTQDVDRILSVPPPGAAPIPARSVEAREEPPKARVRRTPNREDPWGI